MARSTSEIDSHPGNKQALSGRDSGSLPPIHRDAVISLAGDMRVSVDRAHKLYCIVLAKLSKEARIRDYLPILVTKKVRSLIMKRLEIVDMRDVTRGRVQSLKLNLDEQREN